jgi:penicillin G amidase
MHSPFAPPSLRAALAPLVALWLVGSACGDNLDPIDTDDGDDGDDGGDDGGEDGIAIEGLDGPVDVYFDQAGILHARCQSDADCFAVEGYFHAAHRFVQMDLRRRLARGRLAEIAGPALLAISDLAQRRMLMTTDGTPLEERLMEFADERTVAAIEAYTRGVNAWLSDLAAGRNGAELADEYSYTLIDEAAIQDDWEPLDSVACILPLVDQLTNEAGTDILAGRIYGGLPPDLAEDVFMLRPPSPSSILEPPAPIAGASRRGAPRAESREALHERLRRSRGLFDKALRRMPDATMDRSSKGSNNWIVGPSLTGGGALMANDPHLALSHPSIWYLVHLDAKTAGAGGTLHVAGASFAGLPGILLGQNEDIAWGATTTVFDSTDVYVETLNEDGTAVILEGGEEVPLTQVDATFNVAGATEPVTETFSYVPHHGPIIEIDEKAGTALSVRWTGHEADTDINFFLALSQATSVEEARAALENVTTAGQNFVVVDRDGNFGWFPYNRLPTRPWMSAAAPPWLPLTGDGTREWGEYIPYEDLPQALNPEDGFLATANNDMTGALADGDPTNDGYPYLQGFLDEGYRHQRIVERLAEQKGEHSLESMQSIQSDVFSLLGELLTPEILEIVDALPAPVDDPDALAVISALRDWDFECESGLAGTAPDAAADPDTAASARGCAAFHVTYARLRRTFDDEIEAADPSLDRSARPAALIFLLTDPGQLNQGDVYWDDVATDGVTETASDVVVAALVSAGAHLREELGEPEGWLWGRLHTVTLVADLFSVATTEFNSPAFANDGGQFTVDVANPANDIDDRYNQPNGPSMRLACQADEPGVSCTIELPGGQRHDRDSPFYDSMLEDWLTNRPVPIGFAIDEVAAGAVETVRVAPR